MTPLLLFLSVLGITAGLIASGMIGEFLAEKFIRRLSAKVAGNLLMCSVLVSLAIAFGGAGAASMEYRETGNEFSPWHLVMLGGLFLSVTSFAASEEEGIE